MGRTQGSYGAFLWPIQTLASYLRCVWDALLPDLAKTGIDVELSRYGVSCVGDAGDLHLCLGTWAEACREARTTRRPLVAYVHSPDHDDTADFVASIFTNAAILRLLRESCVTWAASVYDTEGAALVQTIEGEAFPLVAVACVQPSDSAVVVLKIEGKVGVEQFYRRLSQAVETCEAVEARRRNHAMDEGDAGEVHPQGRGDGGGAAGGGVDGSGGAASPTAQQLLDGAVPPLETPEERRALREQQDAALRAAEAADLAARHAREEELAQQALAQQEAEQRALDERLAAEAHQRAQTYLRESLPPQPPADAPDVATLKVTFCNTSIQRRFLKSDRMELVYSVVRADPAFDGADFALCAFPARLLQPETTLEEHNLFPRAAIFARPVDSV